jgi:hypothetical protein
MFELEKEITRWRNQMQHRNVLSDESLDELEAHLRDVIDDLVANSLSQEEALIIAIKRMGNTHEIAKAYADEIEHSIWRQFAINPGETKPSWIWVFVLSMGGGVLFHILAGIFGYSSKLEDLIPFFLKNLAVVGMPTAVAYYLTTRNLPPVYWFTLLGSFLVSGLAINLFPFQPPYHTEILASIHLPIFLWLTALVAYCGKDWRSSEHRMSFIRASGEIFIYTVLIGCGLGVFTGLFVFIFGAVGVQVETFTLKYVIIPGSLGAAATSVYLVDQKRSVVENFAPILAKIFSPLFLILVSAFLVVVILHGKTLADGERELLIGFDLLLAIVIGLIVYSISARDPREAPGIHDYLLLMLAGVSILADLYALYWIGNRIEDYGISPNKLAALGENLLLLLNLCFLFFGLLKFILKKSGFSAIEEAQTRLLWVYWAWCLIVSLGFPVIFRFS